MQLMGPIIPFSWRQWASMVESKRLFSDQPLTARRVRARRGAAAGRV